MATISGFTPPSRFSSASRMNMESRGVPGTTICPMPMTWLLMAFSHVMPVFSAKYLGEGAALMVRTGTTKRKPSTEASRPWPPVLDDGHLGLGLDPGGVRRGDGVRAQVVLVDVDQPGAGERLVVRVDDRGHADVARLAHQQGDDRGGQVLHPGSAVVQVHEGVQEPGPGVHLEQQIR